MPEQRVCGAVRICARPYGHLGQHGGFRRPLVRKHKPDEQHDYRPGECAVCGAPAPNREDEAYAAGRLAGFEEGLEAGRRT